MLYFCLYFFFFKQKTAYDVRISDWSSDVCSSDLPAEGLHGRVERWLRRRALEVLSEESRAYAEKAGKPVAGVRLGDPKGRWGSCTSGGRIAYSWRLVMAPPWVRQSVVAHEVAHLVHLNHSPAFHRSEEPPSELKSQMPSPDPDLCLQQKTN